jgi:hypothetical protein
MFLLPSCPYCLSARIRLISTGDLEHEMQIFRCDQCHKDSVEIPTRPDGKVWPDRTKSIK